MMEMLPVVLFLVVSVLRCVVSVHDVPPCVLCCYNESLCVFAF